MMGGFYTQDVSVRVAEPSVTTWRGHAVHDPINASLTTTGAIGLPYELGVFVGQCLKAKTQSAMRFTKGMMKTRHHAARCPVRLSSLPNGTRMIATQNSQERMRNTV
jgi:hypothetical protein